MADIAMLVAEEYERRVRNSRKIGVDGEEMNFSVGLYGLARGAGKSFSWIKETIKEDKLEMIKKSLEPKSQIGVAASHGLFSA
ncbi:hypothetical protein LIER_13278 [Lithospermum erythrorhizon]